MAVRKSRVSVFAATAGFALLVGCAGPQKRLSDRGLPSADRREYIAQNGYGLSKEVRQAFVEGRLVEGMSRDLVQHLFGSPDRTSEDGSLWEYVSPRGQDVVGIRFKSDKIIQIDGDAFGRIQKRK